MIGIVGARIGDIVQSFFAIDAESLGNGQQTLRAKRSLSVNVQAFAFTAAMRNRELTCKLLNGIEYLSVPDR